MDSGGSSAHGGAAGSSTGPGNGGSSSAGSGSGGIPSAGATNGGADGNSDRAGAGGLGGAAGSSGTGGGTAGSTGSAFKCPAGPFDAPALTNAKAAHVPGTPPSDSFNMNNWTNVEGPVWIGDSLYFSEMTGSNLIPPARILKLAPGNVVSVAVSDSGSNGLAVDGAGTLLAAVHKDGSISRVALPSGPETPLVSMFGQPPVRFNSPNDLCVRSDGTIYFSDPNFQNSANPQNAQRLYRVTPGPTPTVSIATAPNDMAYIAPNGVTLSPDEHTLYVSGSSLKKYAVMSDGTLGVGSDFVVGGSGDGMAVDCAGNLYVAGGNVNFIKVYSPAGVQLGTIALDAGAGVTTNIAFGGPGQKTAYITAQGSEGQRGVYSVVLNVPGFPY